jgi:hypothetical protein
MAKKKQKQKRPSNKTLLLVGCVALVVIVAAVVFHAKNDSDTSVKITAPTGTTSRDDQLNSSEISQESGLDTNYDSQQSTNAQSDDSLLGQVGGTADEN